MKKGNPKSISEDQVSVTQNVQNFFELREKNIDFFGDYSFLLSKAKCKAKYWKGYLSELAVWLKKWTAKQMFKRLGIAPPQIKAGSTSENLLNEIWKIIYSLYRAKKLLKKYTTTLWIQQSYNILADYYSIFRIK